MTAEESNIIVSKFMGVSDNFESLDKLITVWKKIEEDHYPEGLMFDGVVLNEVDCGFELRSNLEPSAGGFEVDTWSINGKENSDRTIQESALIVTAIVIKIIIDKIE